MKHLNVGKDPDYILDLDKLPKYQRSHCLMFFNNFGFLVDITPKVIIEQIMKLFTWVRNGQMKK